MDALRDWRVSTKFAAGKAIGRRSENFDRRRSARSEKGQRLSKCYAVENCLEARWRNLPRLLFRGFWRSRNGRIGVFRFSTRLRALSRRAFGPKLSLALSRVKMALSRWPDAT